MHMRMQDASRTLYAYVHVGHLPAQAVRRTSRIRRVNAPPRHMHTHARRLAH
jgi:hypothetical protein